MSKNKFVSNPFAKKSSDDMRYNDEVPQEEDADSNEKQELLKQKMPQEPGDFIKSQMSKAGLSEDTLKLGLNIGKNLVKESKFIDYFSLNYLKPYFEIDNQYVLNKLKIIFFPFLLYFKNKDNTEEEIPTNQVNEDDSKAKLLPEYPDLYIPVMSFITYILLIGFYSASLSSQVFDPQILGRIAGKDFFLLLFQVFITKLILFIFSSSKISFLDCLSYCGYKFALLVIMALMWIFFGKVKIFIYVFLALTCVLDVLFTQMVSKKRLDKDGKMKGMIMIIFMAVDVCFILLIILDIHLYCKDKDEE